MKYLLLPPERDSTALTKLKKMCSNITHKLLNRVIVVSSPCHLKCRKTSNYFKAFVCVTKCRSNQSNVVPQCYRYYKRSAACVGSGAAYFACFRVRRTSSQPQVGDEIAPERIFKGFWVSVLFTNFSAHLARSEINNRAM